MRIKAWKAVEDSPRVVTAGDPFSVIFASLLPDQIFKS